MKDLPDACLEVDNHLPLWVGGDLDPHVRAGVDEHLARCDRCAQSAARARAARSALVSGLRARSEALGTGPDPWPGIRAALQEAGMIAPSPGSSAPRMAEAARPVARPVFRSGRFGRALPVAAAVLVGFFLARTWWATAPGDDPAPGVPPSDPTVAVPVKTVTAAPVAAFPGELRRLEPDEPRFRESARRFVDGPVFGTTSGEGVAGRPEEQGGFPVSLERVEPLRRR